MPPPELRFSPIDGSLLVGEAPLRFANQTSKAEADRELEHLFRNSINHGNGYEWLSYQNASFGGLPCGFSLGFLHESLQEIHFGVALPDVKLESGWPTRESIESELLFVRSVFGKQLGAALGEKSVRFPWGTAWSVFDPKGFQASSGVRFGT